MPVSSKSLLHRRNSTPELKRETKRVRWQGRMLTANLTLMVMMMSMMTMTRITVVDAWSVSVHPRSRGKPSLQVGQLSFSFSSRGLAPRSFAPRTMMYGSRVNVDDEDIENVPDHLQDILVANSRPPRNSPTQSSSSQRTLGRYESLNPTTRKMKPPRPSSPAVVPPPSSFDPTAFDRFESGWSVSLNNPFVLAAYARYLETGQLDPQIERILLAQQRQLQQTLQRAEQAQQQEEQPTTSSASRPPVVQESEEARRQRLWREGEIRRQHELEARLVGRTRQQPASAQETDPTRTWRRTNSSRRQAAFQGPPKPPPALSDPRRQIQEAPRAPPVVPPPSRPY